MEIARQIRSEISRLSLIPEEEIKDETRLLGQGILDSFSLLGMIEFLESSFQIKILPKHLNETYFGTLGAIEALVVMLQKE
ncbi:hypothetical protein BVY01_02830 [bacterium I07]|nr:hypothetical protein BVY01_02830 [bacterium I07]